MQEARKSRTPDLERRIQRELGDSGGNNQTLEEQPLKVLLAVQPVNTISGI